MTSDLIIVGGGAAGMLAAGQAAEAGKRVVLLEHSEKLGKKLYITGKGRCNVTNNCSPEEMLRNVPGNGKFLYSAVNAFTPQNMMELLEKWGCPVKTERGNRVFPASDHSWSITDALKRRLEKYHVHVVHTNVTELLMNDGCVTGVRADAGEFYAPCVLLATGGLSYPTTGSDGSGYELARTAGHTVTICTGSLVPLVENGETCACLQGLTLKNISIKMFSEKGKILYQDFGELQFMHFGLSGPVILSASAHMKRDKSPVVIEIDLKPALDEQKLDLRLLRDFEASKNLEIQQVLPALLPKSMISVILERSGIPANLQINSVTKQQRRQLLESVKHFRIEISGRRPVEEAIVTAGGIKTTEINPATMESRLVKGLYFAGEIIDVDAYTGGFNLQIAWSTAHAAAAAIVKKLEEL